MTYTNSPLLQSSGPAPSKTNLGGNQQKGDGGEPSQENQFLNLMRSLTGKKPASAQPGTAQARLQGTAKKDGEEGATTAKPVQPQLADATLKKSAAQGANSGGRMKAGTGTPSGMVDPAATAADANVEDRSDAGENGNGPKDTAPGGADVLAGVLKQLAGGAAQNTRAAPNTAAGQTGGQASSQNAAQGGQTANTQSASGARTPAIGEMGVEDLFAKFGVEPEAVSEGRVADKQTAALKPPIDAASVKVIRQETHFAPSFRLSPIQQLGEGIVASLKAEASRAAAEPQGLSIKPEGEAVKTLEIKLTPVELGTVKVSLKITGGNVEVTMTASNPQTAEMLKQDRQLLDQMLRATGHRAESITIHAAADDRVAGPHHGGQPQSNGASFSQADQNAGNGSFQNPLQQGGRQENREQGRQAPDQFAGEDLTRSVEDEKGMDQRHDGGVYL
ncbi:flagellar hook-length control protein FliK [Roseibium aggregatum]|uniref:Flagellar hook-length control protein FliK n=1 Tax=Roseibium aggregatum TaxID=187304 RepID=A0A926S3U7_9HYPH|nr:flagellar hook-length control protein FliK [Roseibium aggregatum]MBD1545693.1 flagellar hook-length control protein FliK [Roseibium aggregatum]